MYHYNWLWIGNLLQETETVALHQPWGHLHQQLTYFIKDRLDWTGLDWFILYCREMKNVIPAVNISWCVVIFTHANKIKSNHGSVLGEVHSMVKSKFNLRVTRFILLHEKFLQCDWLRAVVFQLNLKYLHVKITNLLWVVV